MISNKHRLKMAFAVLAIGLIVAFAGCTSAPGGGNVSTTNNTQPTPTAAAPVATPVDAAAVNETPGNLTSWFGAVTDSFGKPYEGAVVVLHLMNETGEAYNMTTTSYVGAPYPGSYVFDNIELTPDLTYAYVQATGNVSDGVLYYAKSDNFTLNKSRISSGFVVMHVPMPDAIKLTPEHPDISATSRKGSPNATLITAQLYLNGKPYTRAGQTVNFTADNEAAGKLLAAWNTTDTEGRTTVLLTGEGVGNVSVTGNLKIGISRNLSDTCTVQVTG